MPTTEIVMPAMHPGQSLVHRHPARYKSLHCGRRWGKTKLGAMVALEPILERGGRVRWVGPTRDTCKEGWRYLAPLADQIPGTRIRVSDLEIEFGLTGGFFDMRSEDGGRSLRGSGLDRLIVDEGQLLKMETWRADLRASLSDKQGDAYILGTPFGRQGLLWEFHRRGKDPEWPEFADFQMPTSTNPFIPKAEIKAARRELPDWVFRQEYLGEFVSFQGKVYQSFDPEGAFVFVDGEEDAYGEHYGAIDPGFHNPAAIGVAGRTDWRRLDLREEVYESGLLHEDIIRIVQDMGQRYGVRMWWSDPADPALISGLQQAGVPVQPAPRPSGPFESWVKNGIIEVEKLLCADPVMLRFHRDKCPRTISDFDNYRYPKNREGSPAKEMPLKVDDHGCDMVRYLVVGLQEYLAGRGTMPVGFGQRSFS